MSIISTSATWLVRRRDWIFAAIIIVAAIIMRFWRFTSLPPGLTTASSVIGIQAQNLISHGWIPGLNAANGYAPFFVWLQASAILVFGNTTWALRIWPAILGLGAVVGIWYFARSWFGTRVAGIAAFVLAVTPWAVMIARNGTPTSLAPILMILTFMSAGFVYTKSSVIWRLALAVVLMVCLLSGPLGWFIVGSCLVVGLWQLVRVRPALRFNFSSLVIFAVIMVLVTGIGYLFVLSWSALKGLGNAAVIVSSVSALCDNVFRTLLMFNLQGDDSFIHNLSGQPLLNIFTGLMLVAGLLVGISRLHERRYRVLLALLILLLIPAFASSAGVPNAAHAAAALPIVMILVAIGTSYMLELWFATFPVNSAARSMGQAAIIILLALTFFQGYTQYFRAWAGTAETYDAYNESAVASAKFLSQSAFNGQKYFVGDDSELSVAEYLIHDRPPYVALTVSTLTILPIGMAARQFVVTNAANVQAQIALAAKFPGGVFKTYASKFSGAPLYYVYEVMR